MAGPGSGGLSLAHAAASCLFLERRRGVWLSQLPTYYVDMQETLNVVPKTVSDELCVSSLLVSHNLLCFSCP